MKKLIVIALAAVFAIPMFNACKKGENDPFMSLKSRKARLTGEWTLKEGNLTIVDGGTTTTVTFNGIGYTVSGSTVQTPYMEVIEINKDHTYKKTVTDAGSINIEEGSWIFGRKDKEMELKNKEYVIFNVLKATYGSTSYSYKGLGVAFQSGNNYVSAGAGSDTWLIDQLKNKEMIIKIDATRTGTSTTTITGEMTYEQK